MRIWSVQKKNWKHDKWLLLIGIAKVFKAALLIALGIGAVRLIHGGIGEEVEHWSRRLNVDAWNPWFQTFPENFVLRGGPIAAGQQIGNAVPVELGVILISEVKKALLLAAKANKDRKRAV